MHWLATPMCGGVWQATVGPCSAAAMHARFPGCQTTAATPTMYSMVMSQAVTPVNTMNLRGASGVQ
jgi:hypothetical protein